MKKFLSFALIGLLVAGLFVSCSSDVEDEKISYGLCSVDFDANSKGLQVTVDGNLATSGSDEFFWSYTATKLDSYGKEGEKTSITKFYNDTTTKGLAKLENLSTGKWKFELFAFLDGDRSKQVYDGSIEVVLNADVENSIAVPMKRSQIAGKKGTLVIDPAKVNIAYDAGTVVVTNEDGESYVDEHALKQKFGLLSDYSYWVYECDEDWKELTTLTDSGTQNKETFTTKYSGEFEPGVHYIKIKISEAGKNDANVYLAMLKVNIYSNCTTEILDDGAGDNSGIVVKRVKEFKITYYEGKDTTIGYESDGKREVGVHPESKGIHSNIESEFKATGVMAYYKYHQYGRTEILDVPTREGYGFAGWYTNFECSGGVIEAISSFEYQDIELYAKWESLGYVSITWDNNFPNPYKGTYRGSSVGYDMTSVGYQKVNCSGGANPSVAAPLTPENINKGAGTSVPTVSPVCPGYVFKGWYYNDVTEQNPINGVLPVPEAANIKRTFKAKWEPVSYTIKLNIKGNYDTLSTKPTNYKYWDGTTTDKSYSVTTDSPIVIKDATCSNIGFLGWSLTSDSNAYKYLIDNDNVENLTNATSSGGTVTLYAVWSDWFVPVDYIRSYGATQYIDTLCVPQTNETIKLTMEWSGASGGKELPFGTWYYWWGSYSRGTEYEWCCGLNGPVVGRGLYFFEDTKYDFVATRTSSRSTLTVNETGSSEIPTNVQDYSGAPAMGSGRSYWVFDGFRDTDSSVNMPADMRLYSLNFYDASGKIVHRFVPCRLLKTMNAASGLATYCQDTTVAEHKGNASVGENSEYGLWDCVGNKFYYNKGTGSFIGPADEVAITFHANNGDASMTNRVQRVKSGASERLHVNLFTKANASFKGWTKTSTVDVADYTDREAVVVSANLDLYATWSKAINYDLFGQVEWIEAYGSEYIQTGIKAAKNRRFKFKGLMSTAVPRSYGCFVSMEWRYHGNRANMISFLFRRNGSNSKSMQLNCLSISRYDGTRDYNALNVTSLTNAMGGVSSFDATEQPFELTCFFGESELSMSVIKEDDTIVADGSTVYESSGIMDWDGGDTVIFGRAGFTCVTAADGCAVGQKNSEIDENNNSIMYARYEDGSRDMGNGRIYYVVLDDGISNTFVNLIPAVLNVDLTAGTSYKIAGTTTSQAGNKFVYQEKECHKGDAGFWDLVNNKFYPNQSPTGTAALGYPNSVVRYKFNGNTALGFMDDFVFYKTATDATLPSSTFVKDGYVFIGWNTQPDGSGTWYSDGKILYSSNAAEFENKTLFAQWKKVDNSVNFTLLDYIQNEGKTKADGKLAYINTKISSTAKFRNTVVYMAVDGIVNDTFGVGGSWSGIVHNTSIYVGTTSVGTVTNVVNEKYKIDVQSFSKLAYSMTPAGGSEKGLASKTQTAGRDFYLFAVNNNGTLRQVNGARNRIYSAQMRNENDEITGYFVPAMLEQELAAGSANNGTGKRLVKGTLGMWDYVTDKFYADVNPVSDTYFSNENICSIMFRANGGNGEMDDQIFEIGQGNVKLNKNLFTKADGCRFIGWNTNEDGSGIWYKDEFETDTWRGGGLFLYAQWEKSPNAVNLAYFEVINYVKSVGNVLVDTLVAPDHTATVKAGILDLTATGDKKFLGIIPSGFGFGLCTLNGKWRPAYTVTDSGVKKAQFILTQDIAIKKNQLTIYEMVAGQCKIDGVNDGPVTESFTNTGLNYYLFAVNGDTRIDYAPDFGISYFAMTYGGKTMKLIPCRLIKRIGAYEAGNYAVDLQFHTVGEVGFWDLESDKFYGKSYLSAGNLTVGVY